ncbi:MAG: hypothetical protein V2A79_01365 [Planctomycetota bacterium]
MPSGRIPVCGWSVGMMLLVMGGLVGCGGGSGVPALPDEIIVWGDPDPANQDDEYASIRDVNDLDERFVVIGTNGMVQFANEKVCTVCEAEGATILIDGTPRINIRFGSGPDGFGGRRPFLVSTDGYYIEVVEQNNAIIFQEEIERFEEDDYLGDDLAEQVGTIPNPALEG